MKLRLFALVSCIATSACAEPICTGPIPFSGQYVLSYSPRGEQGEYPPLSITRNAAYIAGSALNPSALLVTTNVTENGGTKENAIIGVINDSSVSNVSKSRTAGMFQGNRNSPNGSNFIPVNIVAQDNTGHGSSSSDGALVPLEIDVVSSGPDTQGFGRRFGVDIIAKQQQVSQDGAHSIKGGVRIRNDGDARIESAITIHPDGSGSGGVDTALNVLGGGVATIIKTRDMPEKAFFDLGVGSSSGVIFHQQFAAKTSAGALVPYANIKSSIVSNANGAEKGNVSIETKVNGSLVAGVVVGDGVQIGSPTGGGKGVGSVNAQSGYYANGAAGISATKTVRDAAGTGTCTMIFTDGLLTGGTC